MYPHRPDPLSLVFGLLFTAAGAAGLSGGAELFTDLRIVLAMIAVTAGLGVLGALRAGDVHSAAARPPTTSRADAVQAAPDPVGSDPSAILDDPLFGPPIDPDELDRAYRETFGEDDPAGGR